MKLFVYGFLSGMAFDTVLYLMSHKGAPALAVFVGATFLAAFLFAIVYALVEAL